MAIQGKGGATEETAHPPHGFHGAGNELVSEGLQCTSDPLETGVDEEGPGVQVEQVGLEQGGLFNGDFYDARMSVFQSIKLSIMKK